MTGKRSRPISRSCRPEPDYNNRPSLPCPVPMSDALARHYAAHVEAVKKHFDSALAATGYDQVAVFAGGLHTQFLDDADYPFKVNPQFKWWLPLTGAHDSFIV